MCFPSIESSTDTLVPSQQFTCDTGQNAIQNYISLEKNSNVKEDDDVLLSRAGQLRKSKKMYVLCYILLLKFITMIK